MDEHEKEIEEKIKKILSEKFPDKTIYINHLMKHDHPDYEDYYSVEYKVVDGPIGRASFSVIDGEVKRA